MLIMCLITVTSIGNNTKHTYIVQKIKQSRGKHRYWYPTSDFSQLHIGTSVILYESPYSISYQFHTEHCHSFVTFKLNLQ